MMLEYLLLLIRLFRAVFCTRANLVAENLLLRQQFAVLTRPTRRQKCQDSELSLAMGQSLW